MANVTINVGGSPTTATATIRDQAGVAVDGAVFDSAPSWVFSDPSIAGPSTGSGGPLPPISIQALDVIGLKAGVTTLTVDGLYQSVPLNASAQVTVTATGGGTFAVTIDWPAV